MFTLKVEGKKKTENYTFNTADELEQFIVDHWDDHCDYWWGRGDGTGLFEIRDFPYVY